MNHGGFCGYTIRKEGDHVDKDKQEEQNRKKSEALFNSITEKGKPENQNQTHNVRKEGIAPVNQKR